MGVVRALVANRMLTDRGVFLGSIWVGRLSDRETPRPESARANGPGIDPGPEVEGHSDAFIAGFGAIREVFCNYVIQCFRELTVFFLSPEAWRSISIP